MSMKMKWVSATRVSIAAALVIVAAGVAGGVTIARQKAAASMAVAATAFIESLTPELRARAVFPLNNTEERTRWNFIPTDQFPRNGVPLKEMDAAQRRAAHDLLRAGLGQGGYMTATQIMDLENILHALEAPQREKAAAAAAAAPAGGGRGGRGGGGGVFTRDPELYYFSIFGTPSASGQWGMRVEGHHLSVHFTVDGSRMAVSSAPAFFGTNPAEVRQGPKTGLRVLGTQEDAGRALLGALTDAQRTQAVIAPTAPNDIQSRTQLKFNPLEPGGLMAADMNVGQRELLMQVIEVYAALMAEDIAADRIAKIEAAGIEKVGFAWAGSTERGQRYHYRIQGPTFLIEHNNTQNNGNHVHSVWRDFNGDFGRDLLGEHLASVAH
jgi:hypothetical protein